MVERGTEWDGSDVEHRWQRRLRGMSGTSEDGADNYPPIQSSAHDRSSSTPTRESVVWRSKGKWRAAATSHSRLHALAGSNRPEATEGSPLVQLRRREKNGASYEAAEGGRWWRGAAAVGTGYGAIDQADMLAMGTGCGGGST
jgi:hypothetical protein